MIKNQSSQFHSRVILWLVLTAALTLLMPISPAKGQTDFAAQTQAWQSSSNEALASLDESTGADVSERIKSLEDVRAKIAQQRDAALVASRNRSIESRIIEGQIDLLGPLPEAGETEFETERRNELSRQLYEAEAPNRAFQESYLRAVSVIADLDTEIEDLTNELRFTRSTSPLWPGAWATLFNENGRDFLVAPESAAIAPGDLDAASISPVLVAIGVLSTLIGLAIVTWLRNNLVVRVVRAMRAANDSDRVEMLTLSRDLVGLLISLIGLFAIIAGVTILTVGLPALGNLPVLCLVVGLPLLVVHWLGLAFFSPGVKEARLLDVGDTTAKRAVQLMLLLGLALGFEGAVENIEQTANLSADSTTVLAFLVIVVTSVALFLLAREIAKDRDPISHSEGETVLRTHNEDVVDRRVDWSQIFATLMKAAAVTASISSAVGFVFLSRAILLPLIESLATVAVAVVVFFRIRALANFVGTRWFKRVHNFSSIWELVLGVVLVLLVAPAIALFWGVRPAELGDLISLLRQGVTVGNSTVSLGTVAWLIGTFVAGYMLTRLVQRFLQTSVLDALGMNPGTQSALVTGVGYLGIVLSAVIAVAVAGIDLSNLAIILGALSVGIGFGLQSIVSNFVSGIIMLVERPIKEGDSIDVNGYSGIVDKISVRATRIQSFNHDDVIIPNSELITGTVRNRTLTDRMTRLECAVGIAYDSDIQKAFEIMKEVADGYDRTVLDPAPYVVMEELGDSALLLRLYCFIDDVSASLKARSDMYVEIVERFKQAGIAIPFPQSEVSIKSLPEQARK